MSGTIFRIQIRFRPDQKVPDPLRIQSRIHNTVYRVTAKLTTYIKYRGNYHNWGIRLTPHFDYDIFSVIIELTFSQISKDIFPSPNHSWQRLLRGQDSVCLCLSWWKLEGGEGYLYAGYKISLYSLFPLSFLNYLYIYGTVQNCTKLYGIREVAWVDKFNFNFLCIIHVIGNYRKHYVFSVCLVIYFQQKYLFMNFL